MGLAVKTATDLGLKRAQNEDSVATWIPDDPAERGRGALLVVADGMGGSRAGEVASQLTVDTVVKTYREAPGQDVLADLEHAVAAANQIVHEQSVANPDLRGMGTTCTALVVRGAEAFLAHVGDSRAYALRDGRIRQLTHDHSLVAQLVQSRQITPEQARVDPRRNLVTRSIGVAETVEIDAEHVDGALRNGDTLILCTDGLHGLVSDDEIAGLASGGDLDRAAEQLVDLAKERGGHDNISLILARVQESESKGARAGAASESSGADRGPAASGRAAVVALHLCKASRAPLLAADRVNALLECGLEGDRHARLNSHRQVLLMEQEVLEQFGLVPGDVREQVTVRGLDLDGLAFGARLKVGGAVLEIAGPCAPCARMDEIRSGLRSALEGRRGRFVRVVQAGGFAVGDPLVVETPEPDRPRA